MTDTEKLTELLRPWIAHLSLSVAKDLIANGVTFAKDTDVPSKWVSVEKRLPAFDTCVLAHLEKPINRLNSPYKEQNLVLWIRSHKYADGRVVTRWERPFAGETGEYFPTHWMPLPEPPVGSSTDGKERSFDTPPARCATSPIVGEASLGADDE